jgi:hypothetical protein
MLALATILFSLTMQAPVPKRITYEDDVKPIFQGHCLTCHSAAQMTAGLNLEAYPGVLKGGGSGDVVKPGRSGASLLYQVIAQEIDGVPRMPFGQPKLSDSEIAVIREWIDQGLLADATSTPKGEAAAPVAFKAVDTPNETEKRQPMPLNLASVPPSDVTRPHPVTALAASPRAPLLAVAGHEQIFLYNLRTHLSAGVLPFPEGIPYVLRFSLDGATLLAGGGRGVQQGNVVLYDVRTGKRIAVIGNERDIVLAADISPDGTKVALGGPGKVAKVFSASDGQLLYEIRKHTDWITALSFSPDGSLLATADRAGGIFLWNSQGGAILINLAEHKDSVTTLAWRSDSRVLASGGEDGELVLWNAQDGFPILTDTKTHIPKANGPVYGKPPSGILSCDFLVDGRVVTVGRDRIIHIFSPDGKPQSATSAFDQLLTKVAGTTIANVVAAGDYNGRVILWDGHKTEILDPAR